MTDVTLTNKDGEIFTFSEGEVRSVNSTINSDIEQVTFPGFGPASVLGFDFNGPVKLIRLNGILFDDGTDHVSGDTTAITILAQKQWLEANIDGLQLEGRSFTSNYESQSYDGSNFVSTVVFFGNVSFSEEVGNPEVLRFNINLLVGA